MKKSTVHMSDSHNPIPVTSSSLYCPYLRASSCTVHCISIQALSVQDAKLVKVVPTPNSGATELVSIVKEKVYGPHSIEVSFPYSDSNNKKTNLVQSVFMAILTSPLHTHTHTHTHFPHPTHLPLHTSPTHTHTHSLHTSPPPHPPPSTK